MKSQCSAPLPYAIQKSIRRYKPWVRSELERAVRDRMHALRLIDREITAEDIGECVSRIVFGEGETGRYNPRMEKLCIDAFNRGERTTLGQVIDELRATISQSATSQGS